MSKNKPMVVMAIMCILFPVTGLFLTACQSSLALGRAAESPLSTPTVGEWLPLPATDIWSVPPRPATLVPVESRPRPTPLPISPLSIPTPLPEYGVRVTGVREREFRIRAESGAQSSQRTRLINPMTEGGEILVGVVRKGADIWAVAVLDFPSGDERILFEGRDIPYDPQASGEHVVWTTLKELYVYDIEQRTVEELPEVGAAPRRARISGNIVVWEYLPSLLSADSDIWGCDLSNKERFPIVSRPGVQSGPLISERWVLYLDSTDAQAADWNEGLYAIHLDTGETIRLGQVYGRWPHEVSQFYALDVPWVAWSTGDWSDKPELYLYNLETHQAVTVTVTACGASAAQPRRVENLAISENIVIFTCGQPMGYDIERGVFFSIPVYTLMPADGKWWGLEGWSIAGDRIVWVLSSEQESRIYTAQIERRP